MSTDDEVKAKRVGQFAMDLLAQEEMERIEGLTEEELDRELREAGIDPARAREVGQRELERAAREDDWNRRRRMRRTSWISAAAVAAMAAGIALVVRSVRPQPNVGTPSEPDAAADAGPTDAAIDQKSR